MSNLWHVGHLLELCGHDCKDWEYPVLWWPALLCLLAPNDPDWPALGGEERHQMLKDVGLQQGNADVAAS